MSDEWGAFWAQPEIDAAPPQPVGGGIDPAGPTIPDALSGLQGLAHNPDTGEFFHPETGQFFNDAGNPIPKATDAARTAVGSLDRDAFASKFSGPLAGKADLIEQKAQKYGVPPELAASIIAQETGWGKAISGNNVAGMMRGSQKMQFGSLDEGIDKAVANIAKQYERSGRSLEGMRDIYAPLGAKNDPKGLNKDWLPGVSKIMEGLRGSGQQSDLGSSTRVADAGGEVHPIEIENLLGQHAQGKITNKQLRDSLPSGWQIDLRGKYGPYKLWSPSGKEHFINGQVDTDGQVS